MKEGKITIKNNYVAPFDLYMRAERMGPNSLAGEADLFEQMILTVNFRGVEFYSGTMKDFVTSDEALGRFNPNDIEELKATIVSQDQKLGMNIRVKVLMLTGFSRQHLQGHQQIHHGIHVIQENQ